MNTKPTRQLPVTCTLLFAWLALQGCSEADIRPFTSDGCSAFPNGTLEHRELWLECCTAHDLAYWQGGTYKQRLAADQNLQACVAKVGQPQIAELMLAGVRVGGTPFVPSPFRWGYGWPYPRFYGELSTDEKQQAHAALQTNKSK